MEVAMKRYIKCSDNSKIPSQEEYFSEVMPQDMSVLEYLAAQKTMMGKLLTIPNSRNELGKSQDYDKDDKCIHLKETGSDSRTYSIPYTQFDRNVMAYRIYNWYITVYDDGTFSINGQKRREVGRYSPSTLSKDIWNNTWWR